MKLNLPWKTTLDFLEQGALKHSEPAKLFGESESDLRFFAMKLRHWEQSIVQTFFVGVKDANILPKVGESGYLVLLAVLKSPGLEGGL